MSVTQVVPVLAVALLLLCGSAAIAEESPLSIASHFVELGNYDAAITEYKRYLFFQPDHPRAAETYRNIGLAYRAQGLWMEAIAAMRTAVQHASDREKKSEYQLDLAVTLIATESYGLAQLELIKVMMRGPSTPFYRRVLFLQAVAYIYQYRWKEAHEILRDYTRDKQLAILVENAVNQPQKSTRVAKMLSAIIPGAGQVYAGSWRDGINALVLNSVIGFLVVDTVLDGHYLDAVSWGGAIFVRYYRGNIFHAGEAVKQFNLQKSRRTSEALLQRLQAIAEVQ